MTAIVEVKINSPVDMITFGEAINGLDHEYLNCSSSYGYASVTYECTRRDLSHIKQYWKERFNNCKIVSY
jgi:hypothetical protein